MELRLYAAVLIHVNLFASRADNDRGLRTVDDRRRRQPKRAERCRMRDTLEMIGVMQFSRRIFKRAAVIGPLIGGMIDRCQNVALIEITPVMIAQIETITRRKTSASARTADDDQWGLLLFHSDAGQSLALAFLAILARIIVNLQLAFVLPDDSRRQIEGRLLEVEIGQRVLAWAHLLALVPFIDHILFTLIADDRFVTDLFV